MDIKIIIKAYYECNAHKLDNLDEVDQSFERHNLLKLTKRNKKNLNRTISINRLNK